jgi:hypothetical protein
MEQANPANDSMENQLSISNDLKILSNYITTLFKQNESLQKQLQTQAIQLQTQAQQMLKIEQHNASLQLQVGTQADQITKLELQLVKVEHGNQLTPPISPVISNLTPNSSLQKPTIQTNKVDHQRSAMSKQRNKSWAEVASTSNNPIAKVSVSSVSSQPKKPPTLDSLLKKSHNQFSPIQSLLLSARLKAQAKEHPAQSFRDLFFLATGVQAESVSVISHSVAEIFFKEDSKVQILSQLQLNGLTVLPTSPENREQLSKRRTKAYLHGYYKELRLAALEGLSDEERNDVLNQALKILPTFHYKKSQIAIQTWKKTIAWDLRYLNHNEMGE